VTIDFERKDAYHTGSELLQRLQHLEDIILPLVPWLKSTLATLTNLQTIREWIPEARLGSPEEQQMYMDELLSFRAQIQGYIESAKLLKRRSQRTLDIVSSWMYNLSIVLTILVVVGWFEFAESNKGPWSQSCHVGPYT
jgi:hypothetical protein